MKPGDVVRRPDGSILGVALSATMFATRGSVSFSNSQPETITFNINGSRIETHDVCRCKGCGGWLLKPATISLSSTDRLRRRVAPCCCWIDEAFHAHDKLKVVP